VITRLIGKWLKAGVMENGAVSHAGQGTPQGGVLSPLLSNVYLHEVLDQWFTEEVQRHLRGRGFLVRFADDAALVFTERYDAERVLRALPKRFAKYGLAVHEEKTVMLRFVPPEGQGARRESFQFLGFTHYWGRSRKGKWIVKRKTASDRLSRALRAVSTWCKRNRHVPLRIQQAVLRRKLLGHYGYYGITGNGRSLKLFHRTVQRLWMKWLNRRGGRRLNWVCFARLLARYPLPGVRVVHSIYAAQAVT
jgi:hypothetical protein